MSALFNFQSLLLVILLLICTSAYVHNLFPTILDRNKQGSPWLSAPRYLVAFTVGFTSGERREKGRAKEFGKSFWEQCICGLGHEGMFLGFGSYGHYQTSLGASRSHFLQPDNTFQASFTMWSSASIPSICRQAAAEGRRTGVASCNSSQDALNYAPFMLQTIYA
ncbi:hypothetical protein F4679DRAFT_4980 [Xylaria curta]|nr:hypothetical protein F4679DRAFT_4980 [Xylaria curta]